ncbi:single-stranded DNA-binding protein [Spirochaetota bacterium]
MASDINRVVLIGRLTRDPELRYIQSGTAVANFSIANNRTYVSSGEKKEQASFFNCIAWAKLGEVISEYCKKGQRIGIEGRLQQRSWDDQEGKKRSTVEIVVENFQFLTSRGESGGVDETYVPETSEQPPDLPDKDSNPFSDDDIPF